MTDLFCSTIIPTVNRPTLHRAVWSVLDQILEDARYEVIVVNDSGAPLPDDNWQLSEKVQVIDTNRRERSVARNTGAAIARGKYLHFLDDDDLLLRGAFRAFQELAQTNPADWLYGFWRTVDNNGQLVNEFKPELNGNIFALLVSGEGLPLQASLIRADAFFAAGGFDPMITGVEDRDIGRRLALRGDIACAPHVVAQVRIGQVGSTTDWSRLAEDDILGREKVFSISTSFSRVRSSASSSYWHGRVSRAYFGSTLWNLKHKQWMAAVQRAATGLYFMGGHFIRRGFWYGVKESVK